MTIDTLRQVPLFESLDNEAAGELCHLLEGLDCKASTILFRAGDEGDAMYVIERGKVRICVRTTQGHELTLTELGRGDFFGEMALLAMGSGGQLMPLLPRMHGWQCSRGSIFSLLCGAVRISHWSCLPLLQTGFGIPMRCCVIVPRATSMWRKQRG